jgi:hypothetical protein
MLSLARSGVLLSMVACALLASASDRAAEPCKCESQSPAIQVTDRYLQRLYEITYDQKPPIPRPGSYGIDPRTGLMVHPRATPMVQEPPNFPGQLTYWDPESYASNMRVLAFYPHLVSPFHTWQNIADFGKRRYLYVYDWDNMSILDITDPARAKLVRHHGVRWNAEGPTAAENAFDVDRRPGAASIAWHRESKQLLLIQSFENRRSGVLDDKAREPEAVQKLRRADHWKGVRIYAMNGPLPEDWVLLSQISTDRKNPAAQLGEQEGSGSLDVPVYFGGKYLFLAAAPDDSYSLTEYPDYLYSPGYQAWDISNPERPVFAGQLSVPGQIAGDPMHEEAYLKNPRAGNRTSWMGARMPLFLPQPHEQGGKLAFAAMAGLGLYSIDISDPGNLRTLGHLAFAPKFGGTEADNVDTTQFGRTGYIFMNGYPMNDECFEPYKDVFVIDARDPAKLAVVATFPRPMPPADAKFADYCQRRGSFGPKRPGYYTQPGRGRDGVAIYAYYNAGVQVFDVRDPVSPKIAAYYVPRFPQKGEVMESVFGNLAYGVYIEYDRNVVWMFTNHGIYALATPLLGEPLRRVPATTWPPRDAAE